MLDQVRAAQTADPADARLPAAAVDLLARAGRPADAKAAAVAAIADATPARLYHLAAVAAADHLDVSAAVIARAAALSPATADDAYDLAMAFAAVGQPERGHPLFARGDGADWQLADLRYRQATAPSAALTDAWAALADANPGDLAVQRATLRSAAAARG